MDVLIGVEGQQRLTDYFAEIGAVLNNAKRRASFAMYALGLLGNAERKSAEPIAALACADPDETDKVHQRLLHLLVDSQWDDHAVRLTAARYGVAALTARAPVDAWIIDDTGFLKQGTHSVGVQRQYCGAAGKVTNCQLGVSLCLASRYDHLPVDFELYLPHCWCDSPARRREARIPRDVRFRTKHTLALQEIRRAVAAGLPRGVLLADAAYGNSTAFREELRYLGFDYGVGIEGTTSVWRLDRRDRRHGDPLTVRKLAEKIGRRGFRRVTWRDGTKHKLSARFAVVRALPAHRDGWDPSEREAVTLVLEWPDGEPAPKKFYFTTLPRTWSKKRLIRFLKERWRTERVYEDFKGELGLDHYEGRRYSGWHHHISVALCCFAFLAAERARAFPPSARRSSRDDAQPRPT
jgi:SRSO17 transposase